MTSARNRHASWALWESTVYMTDGSSANIRCVRTRF